MAIGNGTRGVMKPRKYFVHGYKHFILKLNSKNEALNGKTSIDGVITPHFEVSREFILNKPVQGNMTDKGYIKALKAWETHNHNYGQYIGSLQKQVDSLLEQAAEQQKPLDEAAQSKVKKLESLLKYEQLQRGRVAKNLYGRLNYPIDSVTEVSGRLIHIDTYTDVIQGQDTPKCILHLIDEISKHRYTIELRFTRIGRAIIDAIIGLEDPLCMFKIQIRTGRDKNGNIVIKKDKATFYGEVYDKFKNENGKYTWGTRAKRLYDEHEPVIGADNKVVYVDGKPQLKCVSKRPKTELKPFLTALEFAYEKAPARLNKFYLKHISDEFDPKLRRLIAEKYNSLGWEVTYYENKRKNSDIVITNCVILKDDDGDMSDQSSDMDDEFNESEENKIPESINTVVEDDNLEEETITTEDNDLPF